MKPIRAIESMRREYHRDAERNTVHRSSLLAPRLPGARVDVSFVNHFLLKRGYPEVACRLTAVDPEGGLVESRTFSVSEPRAHVFELDELIPGDVSTYLVEFFSSANLFYPFPAVIVNHRGAGFLNGVHSYNRVLNDVFEDDGVNQVRVREASIDVHVDAETDTFALFTAGQMPCRGTVDVRLATAGEVLERQVPVDLPRFGNQELSLRALFGDAAPRKGGILTLQQPAQPLFYGRMLAGRRCTRDGALAANHSFYDCSGAPEYWDDGRPSARTYPLFPGLATRIRQYPIFSPCVLHSAVDFHDAHGRLLHSFPCEPVRSPSREVLEFPVTEAQQAAGLASATAFRFRAWAENGGTPRRINHQIVYEDGAGRSTLAASVAISLRHPAMFTAPGKEGLTWGQCPVSADLDTRVGLVFDRADGAAETVELRLIGEEGEVFRQARTLAAGSAWVLDPAQIVPELARGAGARPHSLWYWATSRRPDLSAYSVLRHRATGHCSGDHSF